MKCEIERMEINYTFYFFAFLRKMIKKLLTFCYWQNREVHSGQRGCTLGCIQSAVHRQADDDGRAALAGIGRTQNRAVLLHKSARVCHLHGENLPQHRRLSATSPAPLPPKSSAGNPTDRARRY